MSNLFVNERDAHIILITLSISLIYKPFERNWKHNSDDYACIYGIFFILQSIKCWVSALLEVSASIQKLFRFLMQGKTFITLTKNTFAMYVAVTNCLENYTKILVAS